MKNISPKIFDWLALAALCAVVLFIWGSGAGKSTAPANDLQNTAVRVEVQRYMGYEILPVRYLSLPYDLTMNANEQVQLLDIGVLLLIFVPIVLLLGFRDKPRMQGWVMLSCMLLLVISTANGIITNLDMAPFHTSAQALEEYLQKTAFPDAPTGVLMAGFYQFFTAIYSGIQHLLSLVSGDRDAVTYPLLLLVFVLFFQVTKKRFAGREAWMQGLSVFLYVYLFFWLILSSGIVWYGLLTFPLLTLLVFKSIKQEAHPQGLLEKVSLYSFYFVVGAWLLMGFANRFSNIKIASFNTDSLVGKRLYDPAFVKYQVGDYTEAQVTDAFYANLNQAVQTMNQETNSLIYNVGTRFNFFIRENDKRVFKDNQLDFFQQIYSKHSASGQVIPMLKQSGFKYIMVDFNTPTLDNTPEQTLVGRYKTLMAFLVNDPDLEVIATNRIVKIVTDGKEQDQYGIYGGPGQNPGSFAIFEIK